MPRFGSPHLLCQELRLPVLLRTSVSLSVKGAFWEVPCGYQVCPLPRISVLYEIWYQKMGHRTGFENPVFKRICVCCLNQQVLKSGWAVFLFQFCHHFSEWTLAMLLGLCKTFLIYESGWEQVVLQVSRDCTGKAMLLRESWHLKLPSLIYDM